VATLGGLYVIIDPAACRGRDPVAVARQAIAGGASMLQWRDKVREKGLQLDQAANILDLCIRNDLYLIVNDHADLALALIAKVSGVPGAGASGRRRALGHLGVHVGQKDLPVPLVRSMLTAGCVVGASTNNRQEAQQAVAGGADYIAVGDIFGTGSKESTRAASPERLAEVKRAVTGPVFGIGGINAGNVRRVMAAGADGVAVISAVCGADDPRAAAEELVELMARA
jgi:thiamine monophosphate synthase